MEKIGYIDKDKFVDYLLGKAQGDHPVRWFIEKVKRYPSSKVQPIEYTDFEILFGGNFVRELQCGNCKSVFDEKTEKPYNCCPYCYARRKHDV